MKDFGHFWSLFSNFDWLTLSAISSQFSPLFQWFPAFAAPTTYRSNHRNCFIKIGVLENFEEFTGKHLRQSHFSNKVAGLRLATLWKRRLWHRCFPVNFVKFSRTPVWKNSSGWLRLSYHHICFNVCFPCSP